jgi:hypothetical protein
MRLRSVNLCGHQDGLGCKVLRMDSDILVHTTMIQLGGYAWNDAREPRG